MSDSENDKVQRQQQQPQKKQQQQSQQQQGSPSGQNSNNNGLKKQLDAMHNSTKNNNNNNTNSTSPQIKKPVTNSKVPLKQLHQAGYPMVPDDSFVDGTGQADNDQDQQDKSSQADDNNQDMPEQFKDDTPKKGKRGSGNLDELPGIRKGNSNKNPMNAGQNYKENANNSENEEEVQQNKNGQNNIHNNQSYLSKQPDLKENNKQGNQSSFYNNSSAVSPAVQSAGNSAKTKSDASSLNQSAQCERLLQQNQNLREQLKEMATLLDEITEKEKEQKAQRFGIGSSSKGLENEQIKQRRKELQKQTDLISSNRIIIQQKKRQLEYNFDINRITEKENEVKRLKKQLEEINAEKFGLKRISDEQKKAKNEIDRQEYKDQLDLVKRQFQSVKEDNLRLNEELKQKDKELKKYIDELKMRTEKIRTVQAKLKEQHKKKKVPQPKEPEEEVSEEALSILEEKVKVLETEKANLEKSFVDKMKSMEKERKAQQAQVDKKLLVLKEREKSLKLTQLKIKEITKFIKATAMENEKRQQIAAQIQQAEQQKAHQQQQQDDLATSVNNYSQHNADNMHGKVRGNQGQVNRNVQQ